MVTTVILIIGCDRERLHERSFTGLHQSDIKQMLGQPNKIEELTKHVEHVFGPIEAIWYKIKMGEKVVVWIYETPKGRKELYFINSSTEVTGEFFWYKDQSKNPVF